MDEKTVTLKDFTNRELDYLADMIHEKLSDMGFNTDGNFSFDIKVSFVEEPDENYTENRYCKSCG